MKRAVFLDRDGTINVDKGYVHRIEDFEFIEQVPEAIAEMKRLGYLVIVLSNQSGVARGYFGEKDVYELHNYINRRLNEFEARIDGFYFCPHHPEGKVMIYRQRCRCRKPDVGMLQKAIRDFDVNVKESWVVGDKERDLFLNSGLPIKRILLSRDSEHMVQERDYLLRKNLWEFVQRDL